MRRQLLAADLDRVGVDKDESEGTGLRAVIDPGMHRAALHDDVALRQMHGLAIVELEAAFDASTLPDEPTSVAELNDFVVQARLELGRGDG